MDKMKMWDLFLEELKKQGVDPDELQNKRSDNWKEAELFSKRKFDEPSMIVHWADGNIKTGYIDGDSSQEVHYLEAKVQIGDVYKDNDKLIGVGEDGLDDLQTVVRHFKTSIEPLELY